MITSAYHICKVGYSTMNGRFWIVIFDKFAFEFLMCIFGAFFLNQVGPSRYKVDGFHKFERAHWCDDFTVLLSRLNNIKRFNFILFFALIINKQKLIIKILVKIQDHIW